MYAIIIIMAILVVIPLTMLGFPAYCICLSLTSSIATIEGGTFGPLDNGSRLDLGGSMFSSL